MKFFITKSYPSAGFIYKVFLFLHKTCPRAEILFYVNQIWKEN